MPDQLTVLAIRLGLPPTADSGELRLPSAEQPLLTE
jgi:hypothetical protein